VPTDPSSGVGSGVRFGGVVVGGFLGAGKSRIVTALGGTPTGCTDLTSLVEAAAARVGRPAAVGARGYPVIGAHGLWDPAALAPGPDMRVVTAVDAMNASAGLTDPTSGPLIAAQIRSADVVILTRGDVVDPADIRARVTDLTSAPILEGFDADTIEAALAGTSRRRATARSSRDLTDKFRIWSYRGEAVLTAEAARGFVKERRFGIYRLVGRVRTPESGLALEVIGRGRQADAIEMPPQTALVAIGLKGFLRSSDLDLAFSEAVVASSYRRGIIAWR